MVAEMVSASVELGKASGKKPKDILSRECVFSETSGVFDEFATVSGFSKKPRETGVGNMRENFSFVAKDMHSALNAVAKK